MAIPFRCQGLVVVIRFTDTTAERRGDPEMLAYRAFLFGPESHRKFLIGVTVARIWVVLANHTGQKSAAPCNCSCDLLGSQTLSLYPKCCHKLEQLHRRELISDRLFSSATIRQDDFGGLRCQRLHCPLLPDGCTGQVRKQHAYRCETGHLTDQVVVGRAVSGPFLPTSFSAHGKEL